VSRYHEAIRTVSFAQLREIAPPLKEGSDPNFSFGKDGFFFKWDAGNLIVWNAHPNHMDIDESERKSVSSEVFGSKGVSGMVDHATKVVAIDPSLDETRWSGKLTGDIKLVQSILRSLRMYDPRISDGYSVRFQSGFSRDLGNRPTPDDRTVGDIMASKPIQRGERGRSVTLYHGTNSSLLADILERGLRPSRETGAKNWAGTEFRHNMNAVYLASDRERAEYYARHSAAEQHAKGRLDATPVVLRVTVPTDQLLADDDWLRREFGGGTEKAKANVSNWHDSLTKFGQVAFLGDVPPSAVEVLEGAPTDAREHEFAGLAKGSESLPDALSAALGSRPGDAGLAAELSDAVVKWFKEDYYWVDELDAVDPSDPATLLAAAEVVGDYAWEPDEDRARDSASSAIRDIEWTNEHEGADDPVPDEDELVGEMMEEEAERDRKDRASLASRLQGILDGHSSPPARAAPRPTDIPID